MQATIRKGTLLGVLSLLVLGWHSGLDALLIETGPGLDPGSLAPLTGWPAKTQELSLLSGMVFFPRPRLRFSFEKPAESYRSTLFRQTYFQLISRFQDVAPPLAPHPDGTFQFPFRRTLYTSDPLVAARFHATSLSLVQLSSDDEVLRRVASEPNAIGIVHADHVRPHVRCLSAPFVLSLWFGSRECPWYWLNTLGINGKLRVKVADLLHRTRIDPSPHYSTLVAVGDIMLARRIEERIQAAKDPLYPFGPTEPLFTEADVATGNLECAISRGGSPQPKKDFVFRADPTAVNRLKAAGFKILTLANNHSMDYGGKALDDTLSLLHHAGIDTIGAGHNQAEAGQLKLLTMPDGTRIGFLGYTMVVPEHFPASSDHPGIQWVEEPRFKNELTRARSQCDILVVQFHWGEQYRSHSNARQKRYGHLAVDYGADLVIGHHPHWVQEVEFYKGKFIAYSLGNFVFDMNHRPKVEEGLLLRCRFLGKKLVQVELDPVSLQRGQPSVIDWGQKQDRNRETLLREVMMSSGFF